MLPVFFIWDYSLFGRLIKKLPERTGALDINMDANRQAIVVSRPGPAPEISAGLTSGVTGRI
jgi:hypothetical protein